MGIRHALAILNAIESEETESMMRDAMEMRNVDVLGCVKYDPEIRKAGMEGTAIRHCRATDDITRVVDRLEAILESTADS
jgi:CO dehydrogenase nickel-insertion accessory protein CooC1